MARSRNIKPGFFCNDDLVELDFATRLLFAGLWTVADREGRLEDRPKKIKINVFPADNVDVESMLAQLAVKKFILRYEINGEKYVQITNWHKHQNPHHTEKHSVIPDINGVLTVKAQIDNKQPRSKDGENLADSLIPDSLIPDSLSQKSAAKAPAPKKGDRKIPMPENFNISERVQQWADKNGFDRLDEHLESLKRKAAANGYKKISWDDFFMEAIREDWAKLRTGRAQQQQPKSFAQQEREAGWARWEEQTNRIHPDRIKAEQQSGQVIDVTPKPLEILQ